LVGDYGAGVFTVLGEDLPLAPGTFFLARPGVVHQIRNTDPDLMDLIWVSFAWTEDGNPAKNDCDVLMRRFVNSDGVIAIDEDDRIRRIWDAVRAVAPTGLPEQIRALIQALVLAMAQAIVPAEAPNTRPDPHAQVARQAVRYIEDNLNRPLSVEEIAHHVHVSPRHLTRLFTEFTATSPARYMMTARLDRAIAMLERSDMPVKEIADKLGFGDAAYFTRCFTKRYGTPPASHRRIHTPS
jgi:AraC family L-rhamnose operon transcriptional activator RhaR